MNEFDRRWQQLAARARAAVPVPASAPVGLATRVAAAWTPRTETAAFILWERWGLRALLGATAVMALCVVLEWKAAQGHRPFPPRVEDTVAQVFWLL